MGFAGELSTIALPEVFQNVAFNRLTGVLVLRTRDRRASIRFEAGAIRALRLEPDHAFDYAGIAQAAGAAPEAALRRARRRNRRGSLLALLRGEEGFFEERYVAAVRDAVCEEIIGLFGWRLGSFDFEEFLTTSIRFDADQLDSGLRLDPAELSVEAARRADEWEVIAHRIETEREVFLPAAPLAAEDAPPLANAFLGLLDGTRSLAAVLCELDAGRFHALRLAAELCEAGVIAPATPEQLRALASEAEEAGDVPRAIRHLEALLGRFELDGEARGELVRLYERCGRRNDAARELGRLAAAHEEAGEDDQALAAFERAAALVPYETGALERVVALHAKRGDRERYMQAGLRLAEALCANRRLEDALDVYRELLEHDEESVLLREAVASIHIKLHEPQRAAEELRQLARRAWDRAAYDRALHYYRNVLAVDHDCVEATEHIAEVEMKLRRERTLARRRKVLLTAGALLVALGVWQGAREWAARASLQQAARESLRGMALQPPDEMLVEAVGRYAAICEAWPFTLAAREAEGTVRDLLRDGLHRVRYTAGHDPEAARLYLRRLDRLALPEGVRGFWTAERDRTRTELEQGAHAIEAAAGPD